MNDDMKSRNFLRENQEIIREKNRYLLNFMVNTYGNARSIKVSFEND